MTHLNVSRTTSAALVMLLTVAGFTIVQTSHLPLLERSVCRSHYLVHDTSVVAENGTVPEKRCKTVEIQSVLARLSGLVEFFTLMPGLFLTVPYGWLAGRVSVRLILIVNAGSYLLSMSYFVFICYAYNRFSIEMVWLSCLFDILGGGPAVMRTLLYTVIAKDTDSSSLSSTYYKLSASLLATKALSMATGTFFLQKGIWIPYRLGILVYSLAIPILLALPSESSLMTTSLVLEDTENMELIQEAEDGSSSSSSSNIPLILGPSPNHSVALPLASPPISWKTYIVSQARAGSDICTESLSLALSVFVHDKLSRLCLTIFFFNVTGMGVRVILQQWGSKFFDWTLAEMSYVLTFELVVSGLVLLSLPHIFPPVHKSRLGSTQRTDIWVVKASLLANMLGASCIGMAPTRSLFILSLTIYTLGSGLYDSLKSFATSFLKEEEITRLYVGISVVETIGGLIAGPLWTGIFALALHVESLLVGLPFWLCVTCFFCAFVTVFYLEVHLRGVDLLFASSEERFVE